MTHPYYPQTLQLEGYVPLTVGFDYILGVFGASIALVAASTWYISGKYKQLSSLERALACWFMVTGLIHFITEGYFVISPNFYKDAAGHYLSDVWKEYTKADSRYASRDGFIVGMEAVTAFVWGPLCPVVVYGIFTNRAWRYSLMIIVSLGQIYGDVLYYATCYLEGFIHSRPEPLYFWGYFVIVNSFWIVIPAMVLFYAIAQINSYISGTVRTSKDKNL